MSNRHQLLVMYRHDAARADELRWCLRSLANVSGCENSEPLVVGDPPSWYTGPVLRMEPRGRYWWDQRAKFEAIADSELVADRFALFADDNAVVRPISFDDLMIPRERRGLMQDPGQGGKEWLRVRWKTAELLRSLGLPYHDLECHWPRCWERRKLRHMFVVDAAQDPVLVAKTLYHGFFPQPTKDFRLDMQEAFRPGVGICEDARVIAYRNDSFLAGIRTALQSLFPDPCPWESSDVPVPRLPTIGFVSPQMQHACMRLGELQGYPSLPIYSCGLHGTCGPFGGSGQDSAKDCRTCDDYRPNPARTVRIGKAVKAPARLSGGASCPKRAKAAKAVRQSAVLQPEVIQAVLALAPEGSTILEFGSGESTHKFAAAGRTVVSVEHDAAWRCDAPGIKQVIAPIAGRWYDLRAVRSALEGVWPDVVVVDGPKGYGGTDRLGFLQVLDLIPATCPIVIDDASRPKERELVEAIAKERNVTVRRVGRAVVLERTE